MGRDYTPKYRIEFAGNFHLEDCAWTDTRRPTDRLLEKHCRSLNESFRAGCNQHIADGLGYIPYLTLAKVVYQKNGNVVASWQAPAFEVMP